MNIKRSISVLFLLCLGTLYAQDEHKRALESMKKGDWNTALSLLEESIATHPDWYFPTLMKGRCLIQLKRYQDAIASFQEALALETPAKDQLVAKFEMSKAHIALGEYLNGIKLLNDLATLAPAGKKFDVYFQRGQAEFQYGKQSAEKGDKQAGFNYYSKAVASFSEAEKHPTNNTKLKIENLFQKAFAQYEIGNAQGTEKSLRDALGFFENVLAQDPRHRQTHDFLIDTAFRLTKMNASQKEAAFERALKYTTRALEAFPNDKELTLKRAQSFQGLKRYKEAVDVYKKYVGMAPNDGMGWFQYGSSQMAAGMHSDALNSFNKAIQNGQQSNPNVYIFGANCYTQQKIKCDGHDIPLMESAVGFLQRGLKNTNNNANIRKQLETAQSNLSISKDNQRTDEDNRKGFLANITSLESNIIANENKLASNQERYLATPTPELSAAIEENKAALSTDRASLEKQLDELKASYEAAKKCGGANASSQYAAMVDVLKKHAKI